MQGSLSRPRIAIFSGATATIQNTQPLVTSNKARKKYGLTSRVNPDGSPIRFDALRPQRIAAPVTVYIEQFSAHPLERDAGELYAPPDGYVDRSGVFHTERQGPEDVPVYEVTLNPEDGLYPLPYMARQSDGRAWEGDCAEDFASPEACRQPFFPDGSRLFEEIDRLGIGEDGTASLLSSKADFDFFRPAPSAGYKKGVLAAQRTDAGQGDLGPEILGEHFFPYRPYHLKSEPPMAILASLTNAVQSAMASENYAGGIWLEGSPSVEETSYWLNLLIDTSLPLVGNASQRSHGAVSNDGDRNIIDSVDYILSRIWTDEMGRDTVGVVVIQDEQIFTSREVQKADARPGGFIATGGHGGIVGTMGQPGPPALTFRSVRLHTHTSEVSLRRQPNSVEGVGYDGSKVTLVPVQIKDERAALLPTAIPTVTIVKNARYLPERGFGDAATEVEILARVEKNLRDSPLAGFVAEGAAPYGSVNQSMDAALRKATFLGMPVVKVGRGNAEGIVDPAQHPLAIAGSNLTATKARLLLMACLMKFGSLPPAADCEHPTREEIRAVKNKLAAYQAIFDTH